MVTMILLTIMRVGGNDNCGNDDVTNDDCGW